MSVTVIELRLTFSRVNILTLWPQTADDLMGLGAKLFYPKFTNHGDLLHMGTREIQLALFKTGLLLGIRFLNGAELVAVQAPTRNIGSKTHWLAWARDKTAGQQLIREARTDLMREAISMQSETQSGQQLIRAAATPPAPPGSPPIPNMDRSIHSSLSILGTSADAVEAAGRQPGAEGL
jgi:hypothetical protein